MSRLRAKCPDCKTFTAVALGPEYECHSCGRAFAPGSCASRRRGGRAGRRWRRRRWLELPYPETAVIEAETLEEQTLALAADLPERPVMLGGCCCAHIGAVEGLAARQDRLALIWFDAHGDLNTPESSPSGNLWGMPLRKLIDSGAVDAGRRGPRSARATSIHPRRSSSARTACIGEDDRGALDGTAGTYVAFDCRRARAVEMSVFMPEPGGLSLATRRCSSRSVRERHTLGAGFTGAGFEPAERRSHWPGSRAGLWALCRPAAGRPV